MMLLEKRAAKVNLLVLDVDGVMTDGRIQINDRGEETKGFHVRDGQGLRFLMDAGVEVIIISGRKSKAVEHRAEDLGIQEVHLGIGDKATLLEKLLRMKNVEPEQVCCIGDDLPDAELFHVVGLSAAVSDAVPELRQIADLVTNLKGGEGAIREVCELILKAKGKWPEITRRPFPEEE